MKVCVLNLTTTRLKWQDARLLKVRGKSGIGTHTGTEFTAQRNVVITKYCPRFVRWLSLYTMHIKLRSQLSVLNDKLRFLSGLLPRFTNHPFPKGLFESRN
jgi:hypothetical protein